MKFLKFYFGLDSNKEKENIPIKKRNEKIKKQGEDVETEIPISIYEGFFGQTKKISLRTIKGNMKNFEINIPAGIRDGEKIRLMGQGKQGINGGKNGDLLIRINVKQDRKYKLVGSDIYTELKITPWEAVLGTKVAIDSIDETLGVFIPQGIETDEEIRIKDKGYKDGKGGRGDFIIKIKIMIPQNITEKEKELYKELKNTSKFNPREK